MRFSCPQCSGAFGLERRPFLFVSCGHSFCEICLARSFQAKGRFNCPLCQVSTTNCSLFIQNRTLIEYFENLHNALKIQTEHEAPSLNLNPPWSASPLLNSPLNQQKLFAINLHRSLYFSGNSGKNRSDDFVSHFATKSKLQRDSSTFSPGYEFLSKRRLVKNKFYNPESESRNRSRSISKTRGLKQEFTFGESEGNVIGERAVNYMVSENKKVVVNRNFKGGSNRNFSSERSPLRQGFDKNFPSPNSRNKNFPFSNSSRQKIPSFRKLKKNYNDLQWNNHQGNLPSNRNKNLHHQSNPREYPNSNRNSLSKTQDCSPSFSQIEKEFQYMLNFNSSGNLGAQNVSSKNLKKDANLNEHILKKIELDSLFDNQSNTMGDEGQKLCMFPLCGNPAVQSFCSVPCFEKFQEDYLDGFKGSAKRGNFSKGLLSGGRDVDRMGIFPSMGSKENNGDFTNMNYQKGLYQSDVHRNLKGADVNGKLLVFCMVLIF